MVLIFDFDAVNIILMFILKPFFRNRTGFLYKLVDMTIITKPIVQCIYCTSSRNYRGVIIRTALPLCPEDINVKSHFKQQV